MCSVVSNAPPIDPATPTIDLLAFLLVLSTDDSKTECVLPFPVDTRRAAASRDPRTGAVEVRMPLLRSALRIEDGPDPGTLQWNLRNALGGGDDGAGTDGGTDDEPLDGGAKGRAPRNEKSDDSSADVLGSYFLCAEVDDEDVGDTRPFPEDAFHARDALSRHLSERQEEERKDRIEKNDRGRDEADAEHINTNDPRKNCHDAEAEEDGKSFTLKKAQNVMKKILQDHGSVVSSDLVLALV